MDAPFTLRFDDFWKWLTVHPNCIVRAGTPDTVLYDDEDLHWHFAVEEENALSVQVLRGKRAVGEIWLEPERVTYVQGLPGEQQDEHLFELIFESETERVAAYFFVLTHGYDPGEGAAPRRVH